MKTVNITIVALLAIILSLNITAQGQAKKIVTKTEKIKVSGNCDMCKERIESAINYTGVSKSEWNSESKLLTVTYDPTKTTIDQIGQKIAAAGHDNDKGKANDKTYNALPKCCKYR